jgi:peptidoglycan-N-acetylglucosamine deacetylase
MKRFFLASLFLFLYGCAVAQPMPWPHHRQAAIVLTYDDALLSQLDNAIPQLEQAGLRATFFLTSDLDYKTLPRWREAARKGFELGNHTIYHPCLPAADNPVSSATYTPYMMIREIEVMNWMLYAIDGKKTRTFAYPCTDTMAGNQSYVDTLKRYKSVKYGRLGGDEQSAVITDFARLDSLRVPSLGLEDNSTAEQIINFVKAVQQRGGLGIIMFHGVGGDYITTSAAVHQLVLDYLVANKQSIWVPTFQEAMDFVMKHRQAKP